MVGDRGANSGMLEDPGLRSAFKYLMWQVVINIYSSGRKNKQTMTPRKLANAN